MNFGRYLFAISIMGIGVIPFITGLLPGELLPFPKTMPGKTFLANFVGTIFLVGGIGMFFRKTERFAAAAVGLLFFLFILFPHLPRMLSNLYDPGEWTAFFEVLGFGCGALVLSASSFYGTIGSQERKGILERMANASRFLLALVFLVLGIQHFMYAKFIMSLIPGWIAAHLFWSYIVRLAFLAAAVSLVTDVSARLATSLLGAMFLIWAIVLHLPRVAEKINSVGEWTSLFVAMGMSGICFIYSSKGNRRVYILQPGYMK